jgi:hypothetical protein
MSGWPCRHRPVAYLNNILEQDHRAIKEANLCQATFPSFRLRAANYPRLRDNPQDSESASAMVEKGDVRVSNQFIDRIFGLTA